MRESWEKQLSRRVALSHNNPDYFISWVVDNVPPNNWLSFEVTENAPDSVYTDLSMRLGEMGLSQ